MDREFRGTRMKARRKEKQRAVKWLSAPSTEKYTILRLFLRLVHEGTIASNKLHRLKNSFSRETRSLRKSETDKRFKIS